MPKLWGVKLIKRGTIPKLSIFFNYTHFLKSGNYLKNNEAIQLQYIF